MPVWLAICMALLVGLQGCASQATGRSQPLVLAAASLSSVLPEVADVFKERTGVEVRFSYGASQMLATQIVAGAPAGLFVSAGVFPARLLVDEELSAAEPVDLLSNRLVVVSRPDTVDLSSMELLDTDIVEKIAVANPDLAPAGRYAQEALETLGLWDELQRKLVLGADVRATLAYVQSGNADVAVVYRTDARIVGDVDVADIIPQESYPSIVYPAVVVRGSGQETSATQFLQFLQSEDAAQVFWRHGFEVLTR